ncbi:MAG TPA: acylphosphatase [Casimicrobiaceae bacterium]|jgi:acylphosphatase|nr:acylphosphatase [Casimicrobiaceae bacterium]
MSPEPRVARRIVVSGRVQGVGFRYALADEARSRNLGGWVRNRRDGRVEALLAGPPDEVEAVIVWARHGPPAARVTLVEVEPATSDLEEFDIVSTL